VGAGGDQYFVQIGNAGRTAQFALQRFAIELVLPTRHHDRGDTVADEVGERARFAHETVDAQDQCEASDRYRWHHGQRRRQRDEAGAGDAGGALGGEHGHCQQGDFLRQCQVDVKRLGDEDRGHRQVDVGAVEVERIAARHHQSDHRLGAAQSLELAHQRHQARFGRGRAQHQQQFVADVADEAQDAETGQSRDQAQHDQHEQRAGQIEAAHQLGEWPQRIDTVLADGESHRRAGTDRRELHDHRHHSEEHLRGRLEQADHLVT